VHRSRVFACAALLAACSTTSGTPSDAGPAGATCPAPGIATPGPADTHCAAAQPTSAADCHPDAGDVDAGPMSCPYDSTKFGQESDDDDCKYHVKWSSGALCEGMAGVPITVIATNKTDGSPLTSANTYVEFFTTTPGDAGCDNMSTHPGVNSGVMLAEGPPGTYKGSLVFDAAGAWTMRFHFHGECADVTGDSPHGHAAFHLTLP
jgi:hypothetical protein